MRNIREAEQLLQQAYNIDIHADEGPLDVYRVIDTIGAKAVHDVYYGAISTLPEIQYHLKTNPNGILATALRCVRDELAKTGEYSRDSLNKMYGLEG